MYFKNGEENITHRFYVLFNKDVMQYVLYFFAFLLIKLYVLVSMLPLRLLYFISDGVYMLIHCLPLGEGIRKRIRTAFPDQNEEWCKRVQDKFYKKSTDFMAEFIKYLSWSKSEIVDRMNFVNLELLQQLLHEHRYVVCYSGHFVNYELFAGLPKKLCDYGMCYFYDDSMRQFPFLDKWLRSLRDRCGAMSIPISSPLRQILNLYDDIENKRSNLKGFVIGSLLDTRNHSKNDSSCTIMGHKFPLHYGTERIGKRIGAAFVYAHISCAKRGFYDVKLERLEPDKNGSYIDAYIKALENNIKKQPELWLMWGAI